MAKTKYNNRQMTANDEKPTETSAPQKTYHFAGSGVYQPCSVTASSRDEAVKKWKQKRVKSN